MTAQTVASDNTVADRLVDAREATGLTTAQLARRLGVRTRTLMSWETGKSEPRANRLVTLAGVLNVTPAWLIGGEGTSPIGGRDELALVRGQLSRLKSLHNQTGKLIHQLETHVTALGRKIDAPD